MTPQRWARIKEVFGAVFEQPEAERTAFLDSACEGDLELRAEVELLLSEGDASSLHSPAGSFLNNAVELAPGDTVAHYRIEARLGEGGMGVVYKASDPRLGRSVALKFIKGLFSRRAECEARAVAALNHPHVCTLYDVGPNYLVMELVEGVPLKGPVPVEKAVEYAGQILDALDAAHRKGITHRDLKPANILVTKQGIKLLDFGIAKQAGPGKESGATPLDALTGEGQIVGTLRYMAPEQLEGREADARSDFFAFGCVLYELLTGKQAFEGSPAARANAGTLEGVPPSLDRIIRTCLAIDPDHRFQTAVDLKRALQWSVSPGAGADPVPKRPRRWPWIVAGLAVAALAIAAVHFLPGPPRALLTTFTVFPEEKTSITGQIAVSPDGRRIAFVARDSEGNSHLCLRALDSAETRPLPGTEGAYFPVWSPDGQWIAFSDPYKLKKIDVETGHVLFVADAARMVRGLAWALDGSLFFGTQGGPIRWVPAAGGLPEPLTVLDRSRMELEHEYPWLLPGGKRLLFFVNSTQAETAGIWTASLTKPTDRKRLLADVSAAAYAGGYLLFVRAGALMAQHFDPERSELGGAPEALVPKIGYTRSGDEPFGVSKNGVLAWSPVHTAVSKARLTWFDRSGVRLGDTGPVGSYNSVSLSPDGKRIAASDIDTNATFALVILDPHRETANYLRRGAAAMNPVWSPDSSRIAYGALRGVPELFVQSSSGAGGPQCILENGRPKAATGWSPDGRILLYQELAETGTKTLWTLTMDGGGKVQPFLPADVGSGNGQFSPDGRWVAYSATETPVAQVYVQSFPPGRGKWQVSTDGGDQPRWRRDCKELFYVAPPGKMMSVEVQSRDAFEAGPPRLLFTFRGSNNPYGTFHYDVTADGQKFLILKPVEETSPDPLHIVLNWTTGLTK